MKRQRNPLHQLMAWIGGIANQSAWREIDYLREENRALKASHGKRRLVLSDEQRRRLAAKAAVLGRRVLQRTATIVTPDTLMRWHKKFVAAKWTTKPGRVGRPRKAIDVRALVLRLPRSGRLTALCCASRVGPLASRARAEGVEMPVTHIPGRRLSSGESFYTDWTPRGGDSMLLRAQVIKQVGASADLHVVVETRGEPGETETTPDSTFPTTAGSRFLKIEADVLGTAYWEANLKAQVRLKVTCTGGTAGTDYVVARIFPPIFFDVAKNV